MISTKKDIFSKRITHLKIYSFYKGKGAPVINGFLKMSIYLIGWYEIKKDTPYEGMSLS